MSGKNKLVHKVDGDLTAFAESVARAENEAEAVLKKIDVKLDDFACFRSYHTTLKDRLSLLKIVKEAAWPVNETGDLMKISTAPDLPEVLAGSDKCAACFDKLWRLKVAAVAEETDECKALLSDIKGQQDLFAAAGVNVSLFDEGKISDAWWPKDLKDACVAFVLVSLLQKTIDGMEVTPDMNGLKPLELFRYELGRATLKMMSRLCISSSRMPWQSFRVCALLCRGLQVI